MARIRIAGECADCAQQIILGTECEECWEEAHHLVHQQCCPGKEDS